MTGALIRGFFLSMAPTRVTAHNARATRSATRIKLALSSAGVDDSEDVRSDSNDSTVEQVALLAQRMVNSVCAINGQISRMAED